MRTFVRSKNWRMDSITHPVLKRVGVWTMWMNIHKDSPFESILKKWRDNGMVVYVERGVSYDTLYRRRD